MMVSSSRIVASCWLVVLLSSTITTHADDSDSNAAIEEELFNDNSSVAELFCYGYIINNVSFELLRQPVEIPCKASANNSFGTRWGPPEMQSLACCTGNGRFYTQISQTGAFDVIFGRRAPSPTCQAYASALQATICDPRQGKFIRPLPLTLAPSVSTTEFPTTTPTFILEDNTTATLVPSVSPAPSMSPSLSDMPSFAPTTTIQPSSSPTVQPDPKLYICKSSCDAVYDACGPPGVNFPLFTTYTDGTSLCEEAWGGFRASNPCTNRPLGFPCAVSLGLEVVEQDCLEIITPSQEVIQSYTNDRAPPVPEQCQTSQPPTVLDAVVVVVIIIASVCVLLCIGLVGCVYCRRHQMDLQDAGEW